ncbi:MAG: long-chain fatty acid--CoA ligase [Bacteroidota bacterium]
MNWTRTFEVFTLQEQFAPNEKAVVYQEENRWIKLSSADCRKVIRVYQLTLVAWGLTKGDKLMYMPNRARVEWVLLDAAAQELGIIVVPVHISLTEEAFQLVLAETGAKAIVFIHEEDKKRYFPMNTPEGLVIHTLHEPIYFLSPRACLSQKEIFPEDQLPHIDPADLSCIIYTSGTTGKPKGVMLSHYNLVSNVKASLTVFPSAYRKRCMSFLPYSHVLERIAVYSFMASGASLYLPGDHDVLQAFQYAKPHYFTAVPRILEKMVERIQNWKLQQHVWLRMIVNWALKIGKKYKEGAKVRPIFWFEQMAAKILVFNRFRKITGGYVKGILTGAAYLRPDISRIFATAGIKVREGYGLTETSPIISMNRFTPGMYKLGTAGLPIPGVRVKIDQPNEEGEGEILVKGPNVMKGYYKRPVESKEVFTADGWFRTGDIGKWNGKRFLQITDRKKDIFKTSAGKYIAPLPLENYLQGSTYIDQCMVIGFQKPFVTALIRPDFDAMEAWAYDENIHWTSPEYMILNIKVKEKIFQEVALLNEQLPNFQRVREFTLFHEEWSPLNGLMTYTYKLNRPKILEVFEKAVAEMY